ncbi:MAG: glutamate--cysteine ligase [Pseudomonadota bacterium]|nr:glutamate--cysteine ligase [Pseudomonadota bacterium]
MGQEIVSSQFSAQDFAAFAARLREETALLEALFAGHRFAADTSIGGFELEAWLVDAAGRPAPLNQAFLERLDNPLVVPELSVFNVEFNTPQRPLHGPALRQMHAALDDLWDAAGRTAADLNAGLAMIGILPTVREQDLTEARMSRLVRYHALNDQILRMRHGQPMLLDIHGREALRTRHHDVMLEAATTSFQLHLQVKQGEAAAFFNAAVMLSAPLVAATANSPYLFGRDLWDETRIPLFEQAVAVGGDVAGDKPAYRRVTFGSGFLDASLFELFVENRDHYPPLLPVNLAQPAENLSHLRLHNGTIWRWNRPLVGFNRDGTPHLRIEHRVMPAGPTVVDCIANAALYYGLVHELGWAQSPAARMLSFAQCRANVYAAARAGLAADLVWLGGRRVAARQLLLEDLLPLARRGLRALDMDAADIDDYLHIIEARVGTGRTGAAWQRAFAARHGRDLQALTRAYLERQGQGHPVHEWDTDA